MSYRSRLGLACYMIADVDLILFCIIKHRIVSSCAAPAAEAAARSSASRRQILLSPNVLLRRRKPNVRPAVCDKYFRSAISMVVPLTAMNGNCRCAVMYWNHHERRRPSPLLPGNRLPVPAALTAGRLERYLVSEAIVFGVDDID